MISPTVKDHIQRLCLELSRKKHSVYQCTPVGPSQLSPKRLVREGVEEVVF